MTADTRASRPILVTGSNRSGTTWVGDMLCRAPRTLYLHEPFNPQVRPQWFTGLPFERTQYIDASNAATYRGRLDALIAAKPPWRALASDVRSRPRSSHNLLNLATMQAKVARGHRLIIKDPIAVFSTLYLSDTYDIDVVVCVRSPVAYAGSLKRMQWRFDFGSWARQQGFLEGPALPYADQIRTAAQVKPDIVDTAILRWNVTYGILDQWRRANPEWIVVEHTSLAKNYATGFEDLYRRLSLPYTDEARDAIARANAPDNSSGVADRDKGGTTRDAAATVNTWRDRLSDDEVARVRAGTAEVAERYDDVRSEPW